MDRYGSSFGACATSDDFRTVADTSQKRAVMKTNNERQRRRIRVKPMRILNSEAAASVVVGKGTTMKWSAAVGFDER